MALSCTAPRQGHRPGSAAEQACSEHGKQVRREVLPVAVAAPVSSDEPTIVTRYSDGTIKSEEWRVGGKRHRIDGPARVWYHPDGTIRTEEWCVDDKRHRIDGPAYVQYRPDGSVEYEVWCADDKRHRIDGPARVWYHPDGTIESEAWSMDGEWVDGPAPVLAAFLRSRFPHITIGAATFLCEARPWQEWGDISDAEIELAMTLYPDYADA